MSNCIQNYLNTNQITLAQVQNVKPVQQNATTQPIQTVANTQKNITTLPTNTTIGKDIVKNSVSVKQLDEIFKKLDGKEGKEFIDSAYSEFVKLLGLEGIAPEKITWEKNEGRPIVGDYRFYDNSIVFYSDYFLKENKATQLGIIAHELTHCKQLANMLTTEGMSVEKIAYAYAVSDARAMLTRNPKIINGFKQAKAQGKEKEFMQALIQAGTIKTTQELKQAHAKTLQLPKHPLNSAEGIKAQHDWIAQYNYNGADMKVYSKCPLEKEAYAIEDFVIAAYKSRK